MQDWILIALLAAGIGLAVVLGISIILTNVLALRALPDRRAAWTAGIAYLGGTIVMLMGHP